MSKIGNAIGCYIMATLLLYVGHRAAAAHDFMGSAIANVFFALFFAWGCILVLSRILRD